MMSQIAAFYLLKYNRRQELSDGDCSAEVYLAIWDYCESELEIDGRFNAPQAEDVLDSVLFDEKSAAELLTALKKQDLSILVAEIAADWDLPCETVQRGLETLCSHLLKVHEGCALLYEMV